MQVIINNLNDEEVKLRLIPSTYATADLGVQTGSVSLSGDVLNICLSPYVAPIPECVGVLNRAGAIELTGTDDITLTTADGTGIASDIKGFVEVARSLGLEATTLDSYEPPEVDTLELLPNTTAIGVYSTDDTWNVVVDGIACGKYVIKDSGADDKDELTRLMADRGLHIEFIKEES